MIGLFKQKKDEKSQNVMKAYWFGKHGYDEKENKYAIFLTDKLDTAQRMNGGNDIYEIDLGRMLKDGYKLINTVGPIIILDSDTILDKYVIGIIS